MRKHRLTPPPGSSPPVRGALMDTMPGAEAWLAHPRPCGEHAHHDSRNVPHRGSSPPVRGAPECSSVFGEVAGLIPARAGSTTKSDAPASARWAHPRPCGEHSDAPKNASRNRGSSPPVRGAHLLTWGFIPYTGKIGLLWSQSLRPEYTINNCS